MSSPTFTIAIPTKNRPDRLPNAVLSVVRQTFEDVEVIVCDNSDPEFAGECEKVVGEIDDARIVYKRASGTLSMPDNWDFAIEDARGEYIGVLTDRSVFRANALETVHAEIEKTGAPLVNWYNDLYARGADGQAFKRRPSTLRRYQQSSKAILDYFVNGHPKYATKVVPKLMTSVCQRGVLDTIRSGAGRVCPPVAPDFTSGFLMLAHVETVLTIDEALYVSVGSGNGAEFRRGGELADRFRADLGMDWRDMVEYMPSDACFAHALVLNDLMRLRERLPELFPGIKLNHTQYYLGCLSDYVKAARQGARRDQELEEMLDALKREDRDVQRRVKDSSLYRSAVTLRGAGLKLAAATRDPEESSLPQLPTVWDALAWDEANPREAASSTFVDLRIPLESVKKVKRRRHKWRKRFRRTLGAVIERVPISRAG